MSKTIHTSHIKTLRVRLILELNFIISFDVTNNTVINMKSTSQDIYIISLLSNTPHHITHIYTHRANTRQHHHTSRPQAFKLNWGTRQGTQELARSSSAGILVLVSILFSACCIRLALNCAVWSMCSVCRGLFVLYGLCAVCVCVCVCSVL